MGSWLMKGGTVALAVFVLWYAHHLGDSAGYQRGYSEKVEAANEQLKEDNAILASSLADAQAQIDSTNKLLNARDQRLAAITKHSQQTRGQIDAALQKYAAWACARVPDGIADSLRTASDSHTGSDDTSACPAR